MPAQASLMGAALQFAPQPHLGPLRRDCVAAYVAEGATTVSLSTSWSFDETGHLWAELAVLISVPSDAGRIVAASSCSRAD
jgi:hypothetical protein